MCTGNMERKEALHNESTFETSAHVCGAIHTSACVLTSSVSSTIISFYRMLVQLFGSQ